MFIDTHLHLGKDFGVKPLEFIENAKIANVKKLILSGCELDKIEETLSLAIKNEDIYACLGFHPEAAGEITTDDLKYLEKKLQSSEKVVAVGEIGLDYYWNKENKEEQKWLFEKQLELAVKLNKPVVIHSRDAINETYEILKKYPVKGVIHSYSGSFEMAEKFIELGYILGINGVLTFKNSKFSQVVEKLPLDMIVLETDSPYLTPAPYRGTINESKYIPLIAEKVAEVKQISIKEVERITTENAISMFDLKK